MFGRTKKPAQTQTGPQTYIKRSLDHNFSMVTIVTIDEHGNKSEMGIRKAGKGLIIDDKEHLVMVGHETAGEIHISRDYYTATSRAGQNVIRAIDEVLAENKLNVTRFLLTRPHLSKKTYPGFDAPANS